MFNYGRLYGAGVAHARLLLQQFNSQLSDARASELANEVYRRTKGKKRFAPRGTSDAEKIPKDKYHSGSYVIQYLHRNLDISTLEGPTKLDADNGSVLI